MDCKHCMSDSTPKSPHATIETLEAFISFAKEVGTTKIGISGGEPTSHPHFLKYFVKILECFSSNSEIFLMSNGQFFRRKNFCNSLAKLQKKYHFRVQVSSIEGLYPEYENIVSLYKKMYVKFNKISFVDKLFFIEEHLGRAKKNELSPYRTGNQRMVPSCFNLYAICQQLPSFREAIQYLDLNTQFNFCKPMVDASGNIHVSESVHCSKIGSVHDYSIDDLYKALVKSQPCNTCKNTVPKILKDRFGWK